MNGPPGSSTARWAATTRPGRDSTIDTPRGAALNKSMAFTASAEAYDRFIGRYARPLAPRFADFAGITTGPVIDVGCGPGLLSAVLAERVGPTNVAAVEA